MKKLLLLSLCLLLTVQVAAQSRGKIVVKGLTEYELTELGITTNSVGTGLHVVGNGTYIYFQAQNIGSSSAITNTAWTLLSKPAGSAAVLAYPLTNWAMVKTDVKGEYQLGLTITTATNTHDTTLKFYAADYVGVGNFDGVNAAFPQCMSCHGATPKFTEIFNRWKVSPHATGFKTRINTGTPGSFNAASLKYFTTGSDFFLAVNNNGFDDRAAALGWSINNYPAGNAGNWDTIKTRFTALTQFATIGCESCHGAGGEHAMGGNTAKIATSLDDGTCQSCHDHLPYSPTVRQFSGTKHADALWSSSFAQAASSQNNSLQNCIRCHDGLGYVNFTKGQTTNTTGWNVGKHVGISCATCHDPHGNTNTANLRTSSASGDTLANGMAYTAPVGAKLCFDCHKSRRNPDTYMTSTVNANWGPHYSVQVEVLLGKNVATFPGVTYNNGLHGTMIQNSCVTCHMVATTASGDPNYNKVGGHTWKLTNEANGYNHMAACVTCHPGKTSWNDFVATADYDLDGTIESIPNEYDGLLRQIRLKLPPVGLDSISTAMIQANNNLDEKKAYYNYRVMYSDGSKGMHNAKFAFSVLTASLTAIGGPVPVEMMAFNAKTSNGKVVLDWETGSETNNKGFEIQRKINGAWNVISFVNGKGTTTSPSKYQFTDDLKNVDRKSTVTYRLRQVDFDGTAALSKEIEIDLGATPFEFTLQQNYPNPFNPSTKINYSLPFDGTVKLTVYRVTGEVVDVLVNKTQAAGVYEVSFSSGAKSDLSSGIYFYTLEARSSNGEVYKDTKKMVLMK